MFVWVAVDREIKEIGTNPAVVQQCISFSRGAITAHFLALFLALDQKGQKSTFGLVNFRRNSSVVTPFGDSICTIPAVKSLRFETCAKTLLPIMRSACIPSDTSCCASF